MTALAKSKEHVTKPRILLAHGLRGSPQLPKWYPWLKKELEREGYAVSAPAFPNPALPKVLRWNKTIEKCLDGNFNNVIFVGHSLGGLAILQAIAAHKKNEKALAAIFVGVPIKDVGKPQISEFLPPFNFKKIVSSVENFFHIRSDDDPYVPCDHANEMNEIMPGRLIKMRGQKHFQDQARMPAVLEIIKKL